MKTTRCNLTKSLSDFHNFHRIIIRILGYFLKNFKKFHMFIEELYARLYHWYMFTALGLLVY